MGVAQLWAVSLWACFPWAGCLQRQTLHGQDLHGQSGQALGAGFRAWKVTDDIRVKLVLGNMVHYIVLFSGLFSVQRAAWHCH